MKVVRNNICFVEVDDLKRCPISKSPEWFNNSRFARFDNPEDIEYFNSFEDIVDYDELSNLSTDELTDKICETHITLKDYISKWLDVSKKSDNIENYTQIKKYTAIYDCLTDYKVNRDIIDKEIKELEKSINGDKSLLKTLEK